MFWNAKLLKEGPTEKTTVSVDPASMDTELGQRSPLHYLCYLAAVNLPENLNLDKLHGYDAMKLTVSEDIGAKLKEQMLAARAESCTETQTLQMLEDFGPRVDAALPPKTVVAEAGFCLFD